MYAVNLDMFVDKQEFTSVVLLHVLVRVNNSKEVASLRVSQRHPRVADLSRLQTKTVMPATVFKDAQCVLQLGAAAASGRQSSQAHWQAVLPVTRGTGM